MIEKLEKWHSEKKGRWVNISIDTTFGATCWEVELGNVLIGTVYAAECAFIDGEVKKTDERGKPLWVVYADKELKNGWPGLIAVLEVAFKKANEVGI